jgi:predicted DNA-binding transcriptional regulator AlpA
MWCENTEFSRLLSEAEVAKHLRISVRTLRRLGKSGQGPASVKVGRFTRYTQAAVRDFIESVSHQGSGVVPQKPSA